MFATDRGEILQNQFCAFGLASARLARYNDALILTIALHVGIRVIANGENVRWKLADLSLLVDLDLIGCVDW